MKRKRNLKNKNKGKGQDMPEPLPKSVNVKTDIKLNVKRKSTGETSVASDESHEHFTRSSDIEKKCKEKNLQKQKNIDEAGPSSSNIVTNKAVKRKHDTKSDEQSFCTNFWEKSKEKYQNISGRKKKKKSSDFDIEADEQIDQHIDKQNDSDKVEGSSQSHNRRASKGRKKKHSKSKRQKSDSINKEDISADLSLEFGQDTSLTATDPDTEDPFPVEEEERTEMKGWNMINLKSGVMLTMEKGTEICFHGNCCLLPLCGSISVLGSQLRCGKSYDFFSPDTNSFLTIKCDEIETDSSVVKKVFNKIELDISQQGSNIKEKKVAIFKVNCIESRLTDIIPKYLPFQQIFRRQEDIIHFPEWKLSLFKVGLTLKTSGARVSFPDDYDKIRDMAHELIKQQNKIDLPPVLTVVGGKNSGKSTLNRFLVNSMLNKVDAVYFLECDVGQTEFTPPGCVSLHCISEPILGPPFTHQKPAVYSCFFGGVTPSDDPTRYLTCIEECFSKYLELDQKIPLIVNTLGWNKGVGLTLTVDTIRLVHPLLLVQINTRKNIVNFPPMLPKFVKKEHGWRGKIWDEKWNYMYDMPEYQLFTLDSPVNSNESHIGRYRPSEHRDLTLYSYFSSDLEYGMTLTSVTPYTVPWKDVAIHVCHKTVEKTQILYSINGSLVALCQADLTHAERYNDETPWFFRETPICQCLGFGYVRGIDPIKKQLFIVTPLTLEVLENVNTLIKGVVNLPNQLLLNQRCVGPISYVTNPISTTGSEVLRQRHQKPRKQTPE